MSESIYIKETREFMTAEGTILKESDLTKEEIAEMMAECSTVNKLFGNTESEASILKG